MIRTDYLAGALLVLAFLAYSTGFDGPFLFDDYAALSANPRLKIDGTVFDAWRSAALSSGSGPLRRPIAMFTFALNQVAPGGLSPFALKLVNGLVHTALGVLVYLLASALFVQLRPGADRAQARWLGLLTAAIWLLHPLHVSTVLYAVQRMAQLAALFMVAGLLVFVRYRERWARVGANAAEVAAAGLWLSLLTVCAAYSKENGALLPLLVVVVEVCVFRGVWAGRTVAPLQRAGVTVVVLYFALLLLCVFFPPDFLTERFARREFSLQERVLTQLRLLWHYLSWLAVPNLGAMGFQHDDIAISRGLLQPLSTLLALLGWIAALLAAIILRRRFPLVLFALLFYLVGHSLESGVWPLEMVYEHRNYVPSIGPCMLLAALLAFPLTSRRASAPVGGVLIGAVLAVLLTLLLVRVDTWSDELRLAGINVKNHPTSSRSNYFYANALLTRYRHSKELGLEQQESRDALIASRYYLQRMYETNPRDVAALVMLHSLDAQFVSNAQDRRDWLGELEALLASRRLQASDMNALSSLIECLTAGGCDADRDRILRMLANLEARYPTNLNLLGLRYTYLLKTGASATELQAVLDLALKINPGRHEFLYRQIELHSKSQDVDGMYAATGQWLMYDRRRLRLLGLKSLFIMPADLER
jgi:hypothetical protein